MPHPTPSPVRAGLFGLIFALLVVAFPAVAPPVAAQSLPARCLNSGDFGATITSDTTWSDDVYIGRNLTLRNSVLTIEPGVTVYFCGPYNLKIGDLFQPGALNAVGTAEEPIVFEPAPTVANWGWLYFEDSLPQTSLLQHAILRRGGGSAPTNPDSATIYISNRHDPVGLASPLIDQVRVEQSASNGIYIYPDVDNDPAPAALSRVTVAGSAGAPFRMAAAAASGLGEGIVTENNAVERLQILGDSRLGDMYFDQYWRNHGTPYEILGSLRMGNDDPNKAVTTWEIAAGTTLLIHENRNLTIGALGNDTRLIARGTEDAPIIFTRADDTVAQWGRITFNNFTTGASELRWVELLHGGGTPNEDQNRGVLTQEGRGSLTLDHVTIKFSPNAGFYSGSNAGTGGFLITDSLFELNRIGINLVDTRGSIRGSQFLNNAEDALRNNRDAEVCIDAAGNWWGAANGPADASNDTNDACAPAGRTNSGTGGTVSDGVIYWPWLQNAAGTPEDRSSISPGVNFWLIADGTDTGILTVTLRDANGRPLSGKTVRLETTRGTITQPAAPTDAFGRTTASITGDTTGEAVITGFNVTDNTPLETRASIVFWQGPGDTGGLVQSGGTPYARPELVVEGEPFEVGFPVSLRLPLRNTNATPVDVQVGFRVSNFGIGQRWTQVATQTNTLAPGTTWNAQAGFIPPDTAHRCVAYDVSYTTASGQVVLLNSGGFSGQRNLKNATAPQAPPKECKPNVFKLIPTKLGLKGVRKHGKNMQQQTQQVICVLNTNLTFGPQSLANERDYRTVVTPRSFTPQSLAAGDGVTAAQATASTTMAGVIAEMNGIDLAIAETYARMQLAAQAQDWSSALLQSNAYRTFQTERADLLDQLATAVDAVVAANLAAGFDPIFSPDDYSAYLAELKASGYDAETLAFHRDSGLTEAEITRMLEAEIAALEAGLPTSGVSFNGIYRDLAAESRATAQSIRRFLPSAQVAQDSALQPVASNAIPFVVGNPTDSAATVELVVRPVDVPLHWRVSLAQSSIALEAGEETQMELILDPGGQAIPSDVDIQVAVEGYINGELIGGVVVRQRLPGTSALSSVYLPLLRR